MNTSRLRAFALAIAVMTVALIVAGCSGTSTPTPTPTPTPAPTPLATPTPAPTTSPANQTLENMYQFVERYSTGIDDYNSGVGFVNSAKNLINASDYANASQYYKMAGDRMAVARGDFQAMLPYASNAQQISLTRAWIDAADNYAMSYQNASLAYNEYAYEHGRPNPNYVKYQYYTQFAQQYNDQANSSRLQAEAIGDSMTFNVPVSTPVK